MSLSLLAPDLRHVRLSCLLLHPGRLLLVAGAEPLVGSLFPHGLFFTLLLSSSLLLLAPFSFLLALGLLLLHLIESSLFRLWVVPFHLVLSGRGVHELASWFILGGPFFLFFFNRLFTVALKARIILFYQLLLYVL